MSSSRWSCQIQARANRWWNLVIRIRVPLFATQWTVLAPTTTHYLKPRDASGRGSGPRDAEALTHTVAVTSASDAVLRENRLLEYSPPVLPLLSGEGDTARTTQHQTSPLSPHKVVFNRYFPSMGRYQLILLRCTSPQSSFCKPCLEGRLARPAIVYTTPSARGACRLALHAATDFAAAAVDTTRSRYI